MSEIAPHYDTFLIDAWGVIHDGRDPYPGAIRCLQQLRHRGKRVIILSNAARRIPDFVLELERVGVEQTMFDSAITSGELAWRALKDRTDKTYKALGLKCFFLGPKRSRGLLEELELELVDSIAAAEFILNAGAENNPPSADSLVPLLAEALNYNLPMVCANPDLEAIRAGVRGISAGAIAECYIKLGGRVLYQGKPWPAIYQHCFTRLPHDRKRIAAVGDALRTDVRGAVNAGIDSVFIADGIHRAQLGSPQPTTKQLTELFSVEGIWPTLVLPQLCW